MSGLWVGIGTAAASAYAANRQAAGARNAARGAGSVDITHEQTPWGPSVDPRQRLMDRATDLGMQNRPTFNEWGGGGGQGAPAAATTPGGKKPPPPAGMRYQGGRLVRATGNQGGGAGAAAPKPAAFNGTSSQTNTIRDAMIGNAQADHPLYGTAEDFVGNTLRGEDQDPYRRETFDSLRDVNDPDLARYKDYLFQQLQGGGGAGGPAGANGARWAVASGGGGGGEGPVGAASYIKKMLDEQYGANPFLQQSIDDALDDEQRAFASTVIPGLNSQYAGSGSFGGSMYQQALAGAGEAQARGLAKESNSRRAADYNDWQGRRMNALQLGTEYDMNSENASASRAGAGAGAASAQSALDLQRQGMLIDALGGAVGEGVGLKKFGLGGMGDLANSFAASQQDALGAVPNVTGLSLRDWGAAGDLSLGADQNQSQYDLGRRGISAQAGAANAANRLARDRFNFDVYRDEMGGNLMQTGGAADIVNALTGGYGTTTERGTDRRSQSPYAGSVGGQTVSGALAGGLTGAQLAQLFARQGAGDGYGATASGSTSSGGYW